MIEGGYENVTMVHGGGQSGGEAMEKFLITIEEEK
jgi:hypothetical protein